MKRLHWIDTVKLFAIMVIMAVHFLDMLWPEGLEAYAGTVFVRFFSGKCMVALLTVILGYFAAKPRQSGVIVYTLRRYGEFVFYALVITAGFIAACYGAVWLFHTPDSYARQIISDGIRFNLIYLLRDSLLFECNYIDTYWCLWQFVVAGCLCCLLTRYGSGLPLWLRIAIPAALILGSFFIQNSFIAWVAVGLMGSILRTVTDNYSLGRLPALIIALLSILILSFPMQECVTLYYIQGLAALGILISMFNMPGVQGALNFERSSAAGEKLIGMFMTHVPILSLLRSTVFPMLEPAAARVLCLALYMPLVFLASGILGKLWSAVNRLLTRRKTNAVL